MGDGIDEQFEIERTAAALRQRGSRSIALQFPDALLGVATDVALRLRARLHDGGDVFVLGDTTFGECCVDEVAAEHVRADVVVHFGRACLSRPVSVHRTARIPALYVFGRPPVDLGKCVDGFKGLAPDTAIPILLMFDAVYSWASLDVAHALKTAGYNDLVVESIFSGFDNSVADVSTSLGRSYFIPDGRNLVDYTLFYIGGESLTLTNLLMTHSGNRVFSFDPTSNITREESSAVNQLLRRRYVMVQKAKDADVIGIVVGTLGVVSYLPLINHLKKLITASGKKPYLIAVGKPSPAKLGNFLEIQAFVLVACPENTLVDSREFMQPIVTPFELEMALVPGRQWGADAYQTDLAKLAARIAEEAEEMDKRRAGGAEDGVEGTEDDEPHFSLMTGGYKSRKQYGAPAAAVPSQEDEEEIVAADGTVQIRRKAGAVSKFVMNSAAGEFLNMNRSFKGLEVKLGETAVEKAGEGRVGVASGYVEEGDE
ncbi:putative diphthamide synthesis protein-domain-containing protein [Chytriomyces sp. MP71]|nr:putative diphthamide synthesis protein-domain-containing protein [Chytriomyces sp. MP71]